jgi:hypothetical protein
MHRRQERELGGMRHPIRERHLARWPRIASERDPRPSYSRLSSLAARSACTLSRYFSYSSGLEVRET